MADFGLQPGPNYLKHCLIHAQWGLTFLFDLFVLLSSGLARLLTLSTERLLTGFLSFQQRKNQETGKQGFHPDCSRQRCVMRA